MDYATLVKLYEDYIRSRGEEWSEPKWVSLRMLYDHARSTGRLRSMAFEDFYREVERLARRHPDMLLEVHPLYDPEKSAMLAIVPKRAVLPRLW